MTTTVVVVEDSPGGKDGGERAVQTHNVLLARGRGQEVKIC